MKSVLIYTVHKAASMFIHSLSGDVANELNINYHSVNHRHEYDLIKQSSWRTFIEDGDREGCFGPIRAGVDEPIFPTKLDDFSIVLHVRDPRDVLVSLFYSHTYSHKTRQGGFNPGDEKRKKWAEAGVDKYVTDMLPEYKRRYEMLISTLLNRENVVFVRYEELVSDYSKWLENFLIAFSHISKKRVLKLFTIPSSLKPVHQKLYQKNKNQFAVQAEDVHRHKRQVTPGDHKRKLKQETIDLLNEEFKDVLPALGYEKP